MEWSWNSFNPLTLSLSIGLLLLLLSLVKANKNGSSGKRPPGPPGWPILGNIFQLGDRPHRGLHDLKEKYGPVIWLQLGSINTMVVQNAAAAAELFKKHDLSFCDRHVPDSFTAYDYHKGSLAMNHYGGYWHALRRLCTTELMANKRLNETTDLRRRMIHDMVRWIEDDSLTLRARQETADTHPNRYLFVMTLNVIGNLMLSRDLLDPKDPQGIQLLESLHEIGEFAGRLNIADLFPFLKWMDPQRLKRKMNSSMTKIFKISSKFVQERIDKRKAGIVQEKKDFLDILLDYKGERNGLDRFTAEEVNIIILEMFMAGTDTSLLTVEWSLAELLHNPHTLKKLREEIDRVVGLNRYVEESDMENLPYLQAVIKETYRLHPAIPLLFPRKTIQDTNYMGYHIPKGTQVLVNAWSIGRDSETYDNPMVFNPERFLNSNIDYKGQNFELIPFGSGRRICIGMPLAHRVVPLALAILVQVFDWELTSGVKPEDMDMIEDLGMGSKMKFSLKIIPEKRLHI